jgi:pilus assembly protein Flp/PilA
MEIQMKKLFERFIQEDSGATMVEYAILVALISISAIAVLIVLGPEISGAFQDVVDAIP